MGWARNSELPIYNLAAGYRRKRIKRQHVFVIGGTQAEVTKLQARVAEAKLAEEHAKSSAAMQLASARFAASCLSVGCPKHMRFTTPDTSYSELFECIRHGVALLEFRQMSTVSFAVLCQRIYRV